MQIKIELTEIELRKLVREELQRILGEVPFTAEDIRIEVKSKQNYRSEWEEAAFRVRIEKAVA